MTQVILANKHDQVIGQTAKEQAHLDKGQLHRAISVLLFNKKGELLIQQRSAHKMLWPDYWANTCCSHPLLNESYQQAAERRLQQEFGIKAKLKFHHKFIYQAQYQDIGSEYELCHVFIGISDQTPQPDKQEISDWRYINLKDLKKDIKTNPEKYTPWFKSELKTIKSSDILSS